MKRSEVLERERQLVQERADALRLEFIASELDLAITLCQSATLTRDPERSRRNVAQAQEAYWTAKHFLGIDHHNQPMCRTLEAKLSTLESLLWDLQ
jgi:hypothetical protein